MKVALYFKLPEEQEEYETTMKAGAMSSVLFKVRNELFRPARKHGYTDPKLQELLESFEEVRMFVSLLEEEFNAILLEEDVDA